MHNIISGAENWVIESASRHIYMCLTYKAVRHTWYSPASKSTSCTIFYKVHTFAAHRNYYQAFCMHDTCVCLAHRDVKANGNFVFIVLLLPCLPIWIIIFAATIYLHAYTQRVVYDWDGPFERKKKTNAISLIQNALCLHFIFSFAHFSFSPSVKW